MPHVDHADQHKPQQDGHATWVRFNDRALAQIGQADDAEAKADTGSAYARLIATLRQERDTNTGTPGSRRFVPHGDPSCLFCAAATYLRPDYQANLVRNWLSALDGVVEKLFAGALVADLGCGHGHALMVIATAFPRSLFIGYESDENSIAMARRHAARHGITNIHFQLAGPDQIAVRGFDLVTCFDSLDSLGDPAAMAARIREALAGDGSWVIMNRAAQSAGASDAADDAVGQAFEYGPMEMTALSALIARSGFSRVHTATADTGTVILEARP